MTQTSLTEDVPEIGKLAVWYFDFGTKRAGD